MVILNGLAKMVYGLYMVLAKEDFLCYNFQG